MRREKICGIYKIQSPTGRIYIGQSVDIIDRWVHYKCGYTKKAKHQPIIAKSLKKYGWEQHCFSIVEVCDQNILNDKEIYWIAFYNSYKSKHGMNCTIGGNGPGKGIVRSAASKNRMSKFWKGKRVGKDNPNYGKGDKIRGDKHPFFGREFKYFTELNKSRTGVKLSAEHIEKLRQSSTGKLHSEESKIKLTKSNKETWAAIIKSDEFNSEANKKEMSRRVKEGMRKMRDNPEYYSEERKIKRSEAKRKMWERWKSNGWKRSEETKIKMKIAALNRHKKIKQHEQVS